ncbi:MAG: zinc-ribbon domain-containing protein [Ruminococcus sp.]
MKVWWKCEKGHEWQATVDKRTKLKRNCPYCANQKVLKGYNDLQTLYPELALEWNVQKNNGIMPDSIVAQTGKKYWWKCQKGHEWEATVSSRIRGNGCRQCSRERRTSFPEQAVFYYVKKIFPDAISGYNDTNISELDIYIPSLSCAIEYDGEFYHKNSQRDKKKNEMVAALGIKLYRIKEDSLKEYLSEYYISDDSIYYNPLNKNSINNVIKYIIELLGGNVDSINIDVNNDRIDIWNQYVESEKK